ncbi:diguanylate cyclase [Pseudodesulfovibrio cashew]|uniref:Diguanylate cyclase n=1 Tax=Pseudodesulfovibrio cashew TaxID=2678688 RepID=A0A6I6JKZ5_9BACT|nr:diguanylate cyclase [Pseudodesulfovibrio cashew]QGY41670.1 diguanylate cyclase [Pseudodesulfovibrio cashew]
MTNAPQKLLIVDDSQTNLALLEHMLGDQDCEVVAADTGAEAVALVAANDFALILLDIQMPGMNGYETASRIKKLERGKHVPIIFITAIFQDEENVRQGYETGAVDYLFRPVDVEMLKRKVQVFLDMNRQKLTLMEELDERGESLRELNRAEDSYRSIFERAVEGLFRSTVDGKIKEANPALIRLFGYGSLDELTCMKDFREKVMVDAEERRQYLELLRRDGFVTHFEFRGRKRDGSTIWCSESSRLVSLDGADHIEGVVEDVTGQKEMEMRLKHLATVDSLTGVPNRHLFFDRAEQALANAKRYDQKAAILFIDLDDFKKVNDTYGHQTGDELLCMVAERLSERVRESDTLARLGGDEFGVLLNHVEHEEAAVTVAKDLLAVLDRPFDIQGEKIRVGATVGISYYPDDGKDCMTLVSRADAAMYGVKRRCGKRFGSFRECGMPK